MMMEQAPPTADHGTLRVAIKFQNNTYLQKLDISQTMVIIISDLCREWGIRQPPSEMALWTDDAFIDQETKYMSDNNKHLVKPGSMLILKESPQKMANILIDMLLKTPTEGMANISKQAKDTEMLKMFHQEKTHELVFRMLYQNVDSMFWVNGIKFIERLYTKRLIRKVPSKIINKLLVTVGHAFATHEDLLVKALHLLSAVRQYGRLRYQSEIFDHLEIMIWLRDKPKVQEAALELLNYLVIYPNNEAEEEEALKKAVNQKIVGIICDSILVTKPSKSMQQKLYDYQTLILRPYYTKKVTKVLNNDPEMEIVRRLTNRAKKGELIHTRRRNFSDGEEDPKKSQIFRKKKVTRDNSVRSSVSQLLSALTPKLRNSRNIYSCFNTRTERMENAPMDSIEFFFPGPIFYVPLPNPVKNLAMIKEKAASTTNLSILKEHDSLKAFQETNDPALSMKTFSQLTICNLKYQAANYPTQYEQWALTKGRKKIFAEKLTQLVCRLLEIGRPRKSNNIGDGYYPLVFFTYPYIEEELFCEVFALYDKTSREMRAHVERDIPKVLSVVFEQMTCAFKPRPSNFNPQMFFEKPKNMNELREFLSLIHYENIKDLRRIVREERLKHDLSHKPLFLNYREKCKKSTLELIQKQRKLFAQKGDHLPKVNAKGEILPHAEEFLQLNKKGDSLIIGDCVKQPEKCNHSQIIQISEITDVLAGKKSKIYYDVFTQNENKGRAQLKHFDGFFSLKMRDLSYQNFCAKTMEDMHYWTDAINLLIGKPMTSPTMETEMQEFLDMAVQLKFLDVENLPLPDDPPDLPPLPANYNFCVSPKRKSPNNPQTLV